MQSSKYHSLGNHRIQIGPSGCPTRKNDSPYQRTCLHYSRVHWWSAWHHCSRHFALHLVKKSLEAAGWPWEPNLWRSLWIFLALIWRSHEVWRSTFDSAESWGLPHTVCLSMHWQLTVEDVLMRNFLNLLHRFQPFTVPFLNSLSPWEQAILSQKFVDAVSSLDAGF